MFDALPRLTVANADFVTPQLAIGGDLHHDDTRAGAQLTDLVANGVSHILDARVEASDEGFVAEGAPWVGYRHLGVDDAGQRMPMRWFDAVTAFAVEALADPGAVLLTHCHMGINRGPSAGFAVLLALGWDPVYALAAIRAARPVAIAVYAEDAVRWHLRRAHKSGRTLRRDLDRVADWRRENPLDLGTAVDAAYRRR